MANLYLDICLSDIPRDLIKKSANGKSYLKALIRPRQTKDKDGYDHYIAAWVPKDQRNADDRPVFIGRAQDRDAREEERARMYNEPTYQRAKQQAAQQDDNDLPEGNDTGLPF